MEIIIKSKRFGLNTVIIDDDDFDKIKDFSWCVNETRKGGNIYATARLKGNRKNIRMHRILIDIPEGKIIDHINGNTLDNRKSNLRTCNYSENLMNCKKRGKVTSKYKGVYYDKINKRWSCSIKLNKKDIWIGRFKTEDEAGLAYNEKAIHYFKEFARLNTI